MIALTLYINFGGKIIDTLIIYLPIYEYGIYLFNGFLKVKLTLCFWAKTPLFAIYNPVSCISLFYLLLYSFRDFISFLIKIFVRYWYLDNAGLIQWIGNCFFYYLSLNNCVRPYGQSSLVGWGPWNHKKVGHEWSELAHRHKTSIIHVNGSVW